MRKVMNNKAVKRLAARGFITSRTRNIVAVIAIVLTAVLFTAVFTIGIGIAEDTERSAMLQAGGEAHGSIKNLTQEQYDILKEHPLIKECGRDIVVAASVVNSVFLTLYSKKSPASKVGDELRSTASLDKQKIICYNKISRRNKKG